MPVEDYLPEWESLWEEAGHEATTFFNLAFNRGMIDMETYAHEFAMLELPLAEIPLSPESEEILKQQIKASIWSDPAGWFSTAWREFLKAFWGWIKDNIGEAFVIVKDIVTAAWDTYWPPLEKKIEAAGLKVFDYGMKTILGAGEVTPERAMGVATRALTTALGFGITAHAMSVGFEMCHPLKSLGFHQMTAIIAQLGAFGPLTGATLGQVYYSALRQPMSYAVNKVTRSKLPDEMTLQIMAVKPDIKIEEFRDIMKYHGYSDYWIDRIEATMYHEPRYFELKMMSEDESASEDWLRLKSRRGGFSEADTKVMVSSYIKGATRMQRLDYYKQVFYAYKEGWMSRAEFDKNLDSLELRADAKEFSARAAERAYLNGFVKSYASYWLSSYAKDLISSHDLETHLVLLGMVPSKVSLSVAEAKVKKYKKPAVEEPPDLEPVMAKARAKYSQAYIELYRRELIGIDELEVYLVQLGIHPELAAATAFLEAARSATPAEA